MPDYRIIPNAPIDVGHYYNEGLGDESATGFAAGVQGLQQGLDFGTNLTDRVLTTRTKFDPDKLAEEQLERELRNDALEQSIEAASIQNNIEREYGMEAKRTAIDYTKGQTAYTGELTTGKQIENKLDATYGAAERSSAIAARQANTAGQLIDNRLKNRYGEAEVLSTLADKLESKNDKSVGLPAERRARGIEAYYENPADYSSIGDVAKAPAQQQELDPVTTLRHKIAQNLSSLVSDQKYGEGLNADKQIVTQQFGQKLNNSAIADTVSRGRVAAKKYDTAIAAIENTDFEGQPDYPQALDALAQYNVMQRKEADPDLKATNSAAVASILKKLGPERTKDYINNLADPKDKANATKIFAEAAVNSGDPELLTDDQKSIIGAGLSIDHATNPDETYKKVAQLITGGTTGIDDAEFKNAMRSSDYVIAARKASKGGTQPYSIFPDKPPSSGQVGPDSVAGQQAPSKMMHFVGADGTDDWAPIPQNQKQESELSLIEKTADQQSKILTQQQQTQQQIAQIKPPTNISAPNQRRKGIGETDLGEKIYDSPPEMVVRDEIYNRELEKFPDPNDRKAIADATRQTSQIMSSFKSSNAKEKKAVDETISLAREESKNAERIENFLNKKGVQDIIGREATFKRFEVNTKALLGLADKEDVENLNQIKRFSAQGILDVIKQAKSVKIADTPQEQTTFGNATISEEGELVNLKNYALLKKNDALRELEIAKVYNIGYANGPLVGSARDLADRYAESDASKKLKFNAAKYNKDGSVKFGAEGEPDYIENTDYMTAKQWLKLEDKPVKQENTGSSTSTTIFKTEPQTPPAVGGSSAPSNPTSAPAPESQGSGGIVNNSIPSLGMAGPPVAAFMKALGDGLNLTQEGKDASKQQLLKEREAQDPEFRNQVNEAKTAIKEAGDDPTWLTQAVHSITPDFVKDIVEFQKEGGIRSAQQFLRSIGEEEAAENLGKDYTAVNTARNELLQDFRIENAGKDLLGTGIGMAILAGKIKSASKAGIDALSKRFPQVEKVINTLTSKAPETTRILGNVVTDTAAAALQTGDYSPSSAATMAGVSGGLGVTGKVIGAGARMGSRYVADLQLPVLRSLDVPGLRWIANVDAEKAFAKELQANGITEAQAIQALNIAKAEGLPVTAYAPENVVSLIKDIANREGGKNAANIAAPGLEAAAAKQTAANLESAGLNKIPTVEELGKNFDESINKSIDDVIGKTTASLEKTVAGEKAALKEQIGGLEKAVIDEQTALASNTLKSLADNNTTKAKSIGSILKKGFSDAKQSGQDVLDSLSKFLKSPPATVEEALSKTGKRGGSNLQDNALAHTEKLQQLKEFVDEAGKPIYDTAENTFNKLDEGIIAEFENDFRVQFKSAADKAIRDTYNSIEGVTGKGALPVEEFVSSTGKGVTTVPNVGNSFKFLYELKEAVKETYRGSRSDKAKEMIAMIDKAADEAFVAAGAEPGLFNALSQQYKKLKEFGKALDGRINFFQEVEAATINPGISLRSKFFGSKEAISKFRSAFGKDPAVFKEYLGMTEAYDKAQEKLAELVKTSKKVKPTDTQKQLERLKDPSKREPSFAEEAISKITNAKDVTKLPQSLTGLSDDIIEASKLGGANKNFAKQLINSDNEAIVTKVTSALGKDKEILREGALAYVQTKAKEAASKLAPGRRSGDAKTLLGMNDQQWKNFQQMVGKEDTAVIEKFLNRQIAIDRAAGAFKQQSVIESGMTGMETTFARKAVTTNSLLGLDIISFTGAHRAKSKRAFAIIKKLSDPDPAKVNEYVEEVVSLLKDTPKGTKVVDKPLTSEVTRDQVRNFVEGFVYTGRRELLKMKDEKRKRSDADKRAWEATIENNP